MDVFRKVVSCIDLRNLITELSEALFDGTAGKKDPLMVFKRALDGWNIVREKDSRR